MKLNVLMLTGFPPPHGGVSVWSKELAENLIMKGINVGCILYFGVPPKQIHVHTPSQRFYITVSELKWITRKLADLRHFGVNPFSLGFRYRGILKVLLESTRIKRTLSEEKYDVVIGNHASFDGLKAVLLADLICAKSVVYAHGWGVIEFPYSFKGAGKITRYVLSNADLVMVASEFMKEKVIEWSAKSGKVFIIPPGVNTNKFKCKAKRKKLILFIGFLEDRKDPMTLLKSIPYVLEKFPNATFMFLGSGYLLPKLRLEAKRMGITKNVKFLGKGPDELKIRILSEAKILALPSVREPFGLVLIEAMASGTPCIASRVGGIPEIINDEIGILIPPKKPEALAHAIIGVLADEGKWKKMSEKAKLAALKYDMSLIVDHYINLLTKLARARDIIEVYENVFKGKK